ncbi:MAG: nicotinate phosphoribosyltransferase [Candidatus Omnitrophica bacterium]|nr:nicotinate phosphoribosyltransferase [Candidatus Omnitrophota bacterium]
MSARNSSDGLKVDLYELTMAAGYFQNKTDVRATFELSCHTMPENRSFLVACGLEQIVEYILHLRFEDEDIAFLKGLPVFQHVKNDFFDYLKKFKFSGEVWAMPEGEIFFAREPVVQIEAPIIEAQILETYLLSVTNIESLVATKAARIVAAARADGIARGVIDFGSRRAHGPEAGVLAARASYLAGCVGTSNVYAGKRFGIPVYGTMAHSWVEAFDSEEESFERYHAAFPESIILLVDTYDTVRSVRKIVQMPLREKLKGVRLDSGDLKTLSKRVRNVLDKAGLPHVKILASGNLNEYKIAELVKARAPIDSFGVGTDMVTSRDYPALDLTYKLVQIQEKNGTLKYKSKTSPQKKTIPGKKQVFRQYDGKGMFKNDVIGLATEKAPEGAQMLLRPVIHDGKLTEALPSLKAVRETAAVKLAQLPLDFTDIYKKQSGKVEYTKKILQLKTMEQL